MTLLFAARSRKTLAGATRHCPAEPAEGKTRRTTKTTASRIRGNTSNAR